MWGRNIFSLHDRENSFMRRCLLRNDTALYHNWKIMTGNWKARTKNLRSNESRQEAVESIWRAASVWHVMSVMAVFDGRSRRRRTSGLSSARSRSGTWSSRRHSWWPRNRPRPWTSRSQSLSIFLELATSFHPSWWRHTSAVYAVVVCLSVCVCVCVCHTPVLYQNS